MSDDTRPGTTPLPQLDLTTLSGPELRQLLDSARSRGHAAQSYEILQEMAKRREAETTGEGRRRRFRGKREPTEPHIIDLDLGDPLEPQPEPWEVEDLPEAPHAPLALVPLEEEDDGFLQPQPPAAEALVDDEPPLTLARAPEPVRAGARRAPKPPKPARPARAARPKPAPKAAKPPRPARRPGSALGFALGGLAGIVLGVGVGGSLREAFALPQEPAEPPPMAVAPPPPLPPLTPEPAVVAEAELPAEAQLAEAIDAPEALTAAEDAAATTPSPDAEPEPPTAEAKPEPKGGVAAAACAAEPTPADRAICGDAELQKLQKDLRQAYAGALAVHTDRHILRQRQLAWREARNEVSDTGQLAALYEARIRKLNAATADARRQR